MLCQRAPVVRVAVSVVDLPAIMAVPAEASMVARAVPTAVTLVILDTTAAITAVTTAAGDAAGAGGSAVLRLAMLRRLSWIVP